MRIASINGKRKPDIYFLHVFGALCYPKNDREDIGKLGAKATARTVTASQEPQVHQTSTTSTSIADTTPTPTNSSSHATNITITLQDVDELNPNALFDGNTFANQSTNIYFLHVFEALCYPKNDREDIGKLGAKGDISFFIGYPADSCAYKIYNRRTKKIMETINVSYDELSVMAFKQRISKPGLQNTAPTPTNSSSHATNITITLQDVDELNPNALFDGNMFANQSTSTAESLSSQNMDPSNMHTFYQP
nr:integrase, catalytic region, zinc finger, CCHC-type, peptidase aspartic, catalytic [Tanacetum cinerariifolium]